MKNTTINCSGNLFFWDERLGSADASTLGIPVGSVLPETIAVTSHRTGHTVSFDLIGVETLNVADLAIAVYDSREGFRLHVYND